MTLYTSLESCAQCSGLMSLAGVKQIIYLQNDFTPDKIGNIMYRLANRSEARDRDDKLVKDAQGNPVTVPGAPVPASAVGIHEFATLNQGNLDFARMMMTTGGDFFFKSKDGSVDRDPSITSYLCTDDAYEIFETGGRKLDSLALQSETHKPQIPDDPDKALTNKECLDEANKFYEYVDIEGYRGSPHKL